MTIARTLQDYLAQHGISYKLIAHPHSQSSMETAQVSHVPGDRLAKGVVLEDDQGYLLAVLPSNCHVHIGDLSKQLARRLGLATEAEIKNLFADCELGAIPPVGAAYGMRTVVAEELTAQPELYLEAGDHEHLLHLSQSEFGRLMGNAAAGRFSRHL
jgi:Ala-tRNA(Pro) deacylase